MKNVLLFMLFFSLFFGSFLAAQSSPKSKRLIICAETPGMSATECEQNIAIFLENKLATMPNILDLKTTIYEGTVICQIYFPVNIDLEMQRKTIVKYLAKISENLPTETEIYLLPQSSHLLLLKTNLLDFSLPFHSLRSFTEDQIIPKIQTTIGVSNVFLFGTPKPYLEIGVAADSLRKYNLSLSELQRTLTENFVQIPGGKISTNSGTGILIKTASLRMADLPEIVVKRIDSYPVKLKDIASIQEKFPELEIPFPKDSILCAILLSEAALKPIAELFDEKLKSFLPKHIGFKLLSEPIPLQNLEYLALSNEIEREIELFVRNRNLKEKGFKKFLRRLLSQKKAHGIIEISGESKQKLKELQNSLINLLREHPTINKIQSSSLAEKAEIEIKMDLQKMAAYGLTANQVAKCIRAYYGDSKIGELRLHNIPLAVHLKLYSQQEKSSINATNEKKLLAIKIQNSQGLSIPLTAIATIEEKLVTQQITRRNGRPALTLFLRKKQPTKIEAYHFFAQQKWKAEIKHYLKENLKLPPNCHYLLK